MADAIILQGHLTQAQFDANPTFILGDGQIVWLKDNSGKFKKGDGVTVLSALPFLGGSFNGILKQEVKLSENITKGQAVYISSANGTNIIVSKASNATEATSSKTLGLLETTGVTNDILYVITEGMLGDLDTSTATVGDAVWLGTSGNLIYGLASKPVAPSHLVYIGVVSRVHAVNGEILVKVQNGFELNEIHDVLTSANVITPVDADNLLIKENSSGLWKALSWLNLKATLKTYFDTLYGTIKGSVSATSGLIPFSSGTTDTITTDANLSYTTAGGLKVNNKILGKGLTTQLEPTIPMEMLTGIMVRDSATSNSRISGLYIFSTEAIFTATYYGGASYVPMSFNTSDLLRFQIKVNGNITHAKNSYFGSTSIDPTAYVEVTGSSTSNSSVRIRIGSSLPTVQLDGEINYVSGRLHHYTGVDNTIAYLSDIVGASGITTVVLGADVINNNATANTMQDVTGLSFTANNGKTYWFKFIIPYDAAVATTGSRWGVNASAGLASKLAFISEYTLTASTSTRNAQVQAFDSPATSNASSIVGNNVCIMEGYFTPTANCTFIARFASEISASAITAKAGAVLYYQQTN